MTSKNKFIKGINQAMADMIDKVSYDQPISEDNKKALELTPKYVTIDYMNLLSDPPSNSSDITRKELMYLSKITSNLTGDS